MTDKVIKCKYCNQLEYWGEFRWLSGKMLCRACYKKAYEIEYKEPYRWHDLDGARPYQVNGISEVVDK